MSEHLSQRQLGELETLLKQQYAKLQDEVRQALQASGNDHYLFMTEGAHDEGDQSVADQLAELNLGLLDHQIRELREVEAALTRLQEGDYGLCIDDQEPISFKRLKANPTARRCIACQTRYEHTHAQPGQPKM